MKKKKGKNQKKWFNSWKLKEIKEYQELSPSNSSAYQKRIVMCTTDLFINIFER
jgi:hypothetical protein